MERKGRENRIIRLAAFESMGLAKEPRAGVWKLDDNLDKTLNEISERRRIEKPISSLLSHSEARKHELVIHGQSMPFGLTIRGVVVAKELSEELIVEA